MIHMTLFPLNEANVGIPFLPLLNQSNAHIMCYFLSLIALRALLLHHCQMVSLQVCSTLGSLAAGS